MIFHLLKINVTDKLDQLLECHITFRFIKWVLSVSCDWVVNEYQIIICLIYNFVLSTFR